MPLITLLSDGHLLLEDVPGVGKTTLGKALAQSIQCSLPASSSRPDTLPGDVTGMSILPDADQGIPFCSGRGHERYPAGR